MGVLPAVTRAVAAGSGLTDAAFGRNQRVLIHKDVAPMVMAVSAKKQPSQRSNAGRDFVQKLGSRVMGVLSGFDRLRFRGILRSVINVRGLNGYLWGARVPLTDFKEPMTEVSQQVIDESLRQARQTGGEVQYLPGSQEQKKEIALERHAGKCLHLYHCYDHPRFGLMHVRLQTWFPFTVPICLNGRLWLAKELRAAKQQIAE